MCESYILLYFVYCLMLLNILTHQLFMRYPLIPKFIYTIRQKVREGILVIIFLFIFNFLFCYESHRRELALTIERLCCSYMLRNVFYNFCYFEIFVLFIYFIYLYHPSKGMRGYLGYTIFIFIYLQLSFLL